MKVSRHVWLSSLLQYLLDDYLWFRSLLRGFPSLTLYSCKACTPPKFCGLQLIGRLLVLSVDVGCGIQGPLILLLVSAGIRGQRHGCRVAYQLRVRDATVDCVVRQSCRKSPMELL